jgi:hypothetical protein
LVEKRQVLGDLSPLNRMLKGSLHDLWAVKRVAEMLAGQ